MNVLRRWSETYAAFRMALKAALLPVQEGIRPLHIVMHAHVARQPLLSKVRAVIGGAFAQPCQSCRASNRANDAASPAHRFRLLQRTATASAAAEQISMDSTAGDRTDEAYGKVGCWEL